MRIIHELYGRPQTTASGHAYHGSIKSPPKWTGAHVDVLICDAPKNPVAPNFEGDSIYIEGNIESVKQGLRDALVAIEGLEQVLREEFEANAAKHTQCSKCSCWRIPGNVHGDGAGKTCDG